jgi:hypothetical protein
MQQQRALAFMASSTNFQRHCATWASRLSFVPLPNDANRALCDALPNSDRQRALQALNDDGRNLLAPSRLQSSSLPKCAHQRRPELSDLRKMFQSRFKNQQVALVSLNRPQFRVQLSRLQRPVSDCFPNCLTTAAQLSR